MSNLAVQSYGIEASITILYKFCTSYANGKRRIPVVSVGSGTAELEYLVHELCPDIEWVCIDPSPDSFRSDRQVMIKPRYPTVNELIKDRPSIVGGCLLFANWCLPEYSTYDYEAIILLNPYAFLSTIELYNSKPGAAGGFQFHKFIATTTIYRSVYSSWLYSKTSSPYDIRFVWYEVKGLESKPDLQKRWECKVDHPRDDPALGR